MTDKEVVGEEHACCGKIRRGRPLQMQSSAREAAILRAAAQLLLEVPFDDVTMAVIASKVGMSKRTVYEHFKSREDLLVRAIIDLSRTIFLPLKQSDADRPLRERLSILLRFNAPAGGEMNTLEFLRSVVAKAQTYPVLAQKLHANGYGALAGFVQIEIIRAIEGGEIALPDADIGLATEMLLDMAFENKLIRLLHPNGPPQDQVQVERRRELAITIFLRGCAL